MILAVSAARRDDLHKKYQAWIEDKNSSSKEKTISASQTTGSGLTEEHLVGESGTTSSSCFRQKRQT